MKEKIKLIVLIIIFILFLICINTFMKNKTDSIIDRSKVLEQEKNSTINKNEIIEVIEENFDEEVLNSDKKVLIDFYATWCEPCKQLSPIIDIVSSEIEDVKFVRIDVDKNKELSYKYQIQYMPTLIVIENGNEINRSVGLINKDSIKKLIGK